MLNDRKCTTVQVLSFLLLYPFYLFPLQAQVLAVADRSGEAEKLTLEIISKEISCVECYRLLSAIYSKRGNYTEVCEYNPLLVHMVFFIFQTHCFDFNEQ